MPHNYLSPANKTTFNLKDQSKYLYIILSKPGIISDMVFTRESGYEYFQGCNIPLGLYDQGLLKPLPQLACSQWFPEKGVIGIRYIMVIVTRPNGHNITDDNPNGFGHTCLMGLWGLHTEKAVQCCRKTCVDRVNKVLAFFCPFCEFWTTNDAALNNHICKHYGVVMLCYHNGYTMGSVASMRRHMHVIHRILMESVPEKRKRIR